MLNREKTGFVWLGALGLSLALMLPAPNAWGQLATDLICNGCVQGSDIQNGTIGPGKLIPGSINATTIANGVIGPNKLIPGSINQTTIAADAIRSNKILDGEVTSADIQNGGVFGIDIANGTITQADIATSGVASSEVLNNSLLGIDIQDNTITTNDVQNNSLTGADILDNSVGSADITNNSLTNADVQDGSLFDVDIADEPGVEFLNDTGLGTDISVTTAWAVMRSLSVTAPTSGFVTCIAAGHADWEFQSQRRQLEAGWDNIGGATAPDSYNRLDLTSPAGNTDHRVPMTSMHTFSVSGGTTTFSLKARCLSCAVNEMDYNFHSASCMFFPTRY